MQILKFSNLGPLQFWRPITFFTNLQLTWGLKQSCSPCREFSNNMLHITYTQENLGDSWLMANLTSGPSFEHNLCFSYPNESCKPILGIYVPRAFQRYKECLNPMNFDPCNRSLKIRESIEIPTPKVTVPLRVWGFIPSHSFAFPKAWNVTPELPSWPASLQARG
jgi:hypothetical protein